ncbi:hypothetical protein D9O36_10590 [Zobellia amurskyensis]|uniref:Uncharacterized protein n=1 Tax=Zobellia amurskyensis TaxID=248905 RepID=A0A7X3D275_9FLAO|nr:hypothetical protein [Zobellia amurskyensis]MUH36288.1 hypothetical protein [Zobellia amurskyensis]
MKKTLFLGILTLLIACDDGDLQIEQVDFDSVSITTCGDLEDPLETTFFFKLDGDEALLLELESGLLFDQTSEEGTLTSSLGGSSDLVYRLFTDDVSQDYFCSTIPTLEPTVLNENTATGGDIAVNTKVTAVSKDVKTYSHTILITGLALTNDQNESITDSSTMTYGTFKTSTAISAKLDVPFSNYEAITNFSECESAIVDGSLRLYKTINDEYVSLDIPLTILANEATVENDPRTATLENGEFSYTVLDTIVTDEMICTTSPLSEEIIAHNFNSSSGDISVETVASEPDGAGDITYTHTISLNNLLLVLKGDGEDVADVTLSEITNVVLGTYTTTTN